MSLSTVSVDTYLEDYGTTVGSANVSHSLTMYRAESGALVFGAGTVFWSWGLDDQHEGAETPEDQNVKQAMVNMFADMGIQPGTLDASLILASQSTDTIKPIATITPFGTNFVEGQKVTITGTAQDFGGGIVAGVEISLDGGQSWWKTVGRESWSYSWVVQAAGKLQHHGPRGRRQPQSGRPLRQRRRLRSVCRRHRACGPSQPRQSRRP